MELSERIRDAKFQKALDSPWRTNSEYQRNPDPQCKIVMGNIFAFLHYVAQKAYRYSELLENNDYLISRKLVPETPLHLEPKEAAEFAKYFVRLEDGGTTPFPEEFLISSEESSRYDHLQEITLQRAKEITDYLENQIFNHVLIHTYVLQGYHSKP